MEVTDSSRFARTVKFYCSRELREASSRELFAVSVTLNDIVLAPARTVLTSYRSRCLYRVKPRCLYRVKPRCLYRVKPRYTHRELLLATGYWLLAFQLIFPSSGHRPLASGLYWPLAFKNSSHFRSNSIRIWYFWLPATGIRLIWATGVRLAQATGDWRPANIIKD